MPYMYGLFICMACLCVWQGRLEDGTIFDSTIDEAWLKVWGLGFSLGFASRVEGLPALLNFSPSNLFLNSR